MDWLHFRDPVSTWTHLIWMILAFPATMLLWQRSRGDRPKQLSLLVFGLGAIACFGASALYHAVNLPYEQLKWFIAGDYIGIHLLIAASTTGIGYTLLPQRTRCILLSAIWAVTALAIVARLTLDNLPRWLNPVIYLVLGWGLASAHPGLVRAVSARPVRIVWLGGLLYTIGALFYLTRWPVIWPDVFGSHELLHLFVMGGSLAHFWFMLKYVVPFDRARLEAQNLRIVAVAGN